MEAGVPAGVAWKVHARGGLVVQDEVMYCQKAPLVHSPLHLMSIWSRPCR